MYFFNIYLQINTRCKNCHNKQGLNYTNLQLKQTIIASISVSNSDTT